jgi:hypothetical protein
MSNTHWRRSFIEQPVITGDFKPKFYWTGNIFDDAERINRPHIKKEGERENRIKETINVLNELNGMTEFTWNDAVNIQNRLLSSNNWKGIKSGYRFHDVKIIQSGGEFEITPEYNKVKGLTEQMFPVGVMPKEELLEWYKQIQTIHPLSDLNGRVFGIIVAVLNQHNISK